jgi:RHS repeat-associated protein
MICNSLRDTLSHSPRDTRCRLPRGMLIAASLLASSAAGATGFPTAGSVDAATLSLPNAPASVRGLAGDAGVSVFTGQVSYAVPIELPPGRGRFAPSLDLTYEGALGNGPLGVGWTLSVPSIRRSTRQGVPRYDDPSSTTLDWARADELELVGIAGGGRLVAVRDGTWRVEGRGEEVRVAFSGSVATVTDRDGVIYHLGTTPAGRLFDPSRGVFAWFTQAILHPSGETIVLRYSKDRGQVYLDNVAWANQGTAAAPDYRYQAQLTWETRRDVFSSYRAGFVVTTGRRLRSLAVLARNDATGTDDVARRYELTYDETLPLTRMVQVLHVGRGGVGALPATSFGYGASSAAATVQFTGNGGWQLSDTSVTLLDVDGDGLADLVRFDGQRNAIYYRRNLANSAGPGHVFDVERPLPSDILTLPILGGDSRFMGMQGKGRPELVRRVGNSWQVQRLEAQQLVSLGAWGGTANLALFGAGIAFADLNGDDRADMLVASGQNLQYRLNGAAALAPVLTAVTPPVLPGVAGARFQDMNGDGLADAVSVSLAAGTALVYPGRGDGTFDTATTIALPAPRPGDLNDVRFADLNRDGVADVVYASSGSVTWYPARPDGTLLAPVQLPPPSSAVNPVVGLADMNGNGSEDVVWSASGTIWALDLAGTTTAAMLTSISNGLGQTTSFSYEASAMLALRAEAALQPWAERLPISVPVPTTVTKALASGGPPRIDQLAVRDGFWDGDEHQFGGFLDSTRTQVGATAGATLVERSRFNAGRGAARVLRGTARQIERRDGAGTLLQIEEIDWEALRIPSFPVDVPGLRRAVARERRTYHHEGQVTPVQVRTRYGFDAEGNTNDEQRDGRLDRTGDEVHVTRVFASNPARNVRGRVVEERIENAAGLASLTRTFYDGATYPYTAGVAAMAYGTVDRGWPRRIDAFLASASRWVTIERTDHDARGNVTGRYSDGVARTVAYDAAGVFAISESVAPTAARTLTWTASWDSVMGQLVSRGDPNGVTHTIGYDSLGRLSSLALGTAAPYQTYSYLWSSPRPRTTVVANDGAAGTRTMAHVFDSRGELLYDADRLGTQWIVRSHASRDARGEVSFVAEPYHHNSATLPAALPAGTSGASTVRDALGRVVAHTLSNGAVQAIARRPLEETVSYPQLAPLIRRFDGQGRIYRTERTIGTRVESVDADHDAAGRITRLALQAGVVAHTYGYDTLGRLVSASDPDIGPRALTWYDTGRLASLTNARGDVAAFSYDAAGRLTRRASGTLIYDYHYDQPRTGNAVAKRTLGRLAWADEPQGDSIELSYDDFGRERSRRRTIAGVTGEETRVFSPAGFVLSQATDDGFATPFQYDSAGRLNAIPGYWMLVAADAAGRTSAERFANGTEQTYERDALGLPTTIRLHIPGPSGPITPFSVLIARNTYGAPTAITDVDGVGRDQSASFTFDPAGRLTRSTTGGATINYGYDGLQNMVQRTAGQALPIATGTYRYAERGFGPRQLTSVGALTFDYDAAGRMTRRGTTTMQWDPFDRMTRADLAGGAWVEHRYGYDGERTYTRDSTGAIERRFSPAMVERGGNREHYLRTGDRLIAKVVHAGNTFTPTYFHTGVGAGPGAFTGAQGQLTDERVYEPFGAMLAGTLAVDSTGGLNKPVDALTGWSDHGARWMSSETARWLAPDPIVKGPDPKFLGEPWALHPYGYVLNNPTLYWDPDGRQEKTTPQPDATPPEEYAFRTFIYNHWKDKIQGWLGNNPVKVPVGPATVETNGERLRLRSFRVGNTTFLDVDGPGDNVVVNGGPFAFGVHRSLDGSGYINATFSQTKKDGDLEMYSHFEARLTINGETTQNHNVGHLTFYEQITIKYKGVKLVDKRFEQDGGPVGLPGGLSPKLDKAQEQREAAGHVKEGGTHWNQCASGQC